MLSRLVAPGGTLVLGHADPLPREGFVREGANERFAWRRVHTPRGKAPGKRPLEPTQRVSEAPVDEVASSAPARPTIETARKLADEGSLDEATAVCEELLSDGGHDAESYALLGTLHHARGKTADAIRAWQRAVYLDPEHADALVQLGLALRARGDVMRASALLSRAARLNARGAIARTAGPETRAIPGGVRWHAEDRERSGRLALEASAPRARREP